MSGPYQQEFQRLRSSGATLPVNPLRARLEAQASVEQAFSGSLVQDVASQNYNRQRLGAHQLFAPGMDRQSAELTQTMRRTATSANSIGTNGGFGGDMQWTMFPQRDPFQFWETKGHWVDLNDQASNTKLRRWARLMYLTHHLVPSLIDIYTRFPLLGMEFSHKDKKLVQWYGDLFWDGLEYEEFLFDLSREYWTVGEVFPMAQWHEGLGVWISDEFINPEDVEVESTQALMAGGATPFKIKPPEDLQKLVNGGSDPAAAKALQENWPELYEHARAGKPFPVSDVLMKHLKFKVDPWSTRGTPILLRAFRQLMLEESLNAAQESVADRLYSPLLLANLGLDNVDDQGPWIPEPEDLTSLRNDLLVALNSDFRLMVHHHGLKMSNAWGREAMPRLDSDFTRVTDALLQVFGVGRELLMGGKSAVPYASGALNRELITQMLQTHQVGVRRFVRSRQEVVARRQGHYEYEKKGDRRIPVMETVLLVDEETGEEYVDQRPKLAIPELKFRSMNLRDEKVERDFFMQLENSGFPISQQTKAVNLPIDFDEERERRKEEKIQLVLDEQEFQDDLFKALYQRNLSAPEELAQAYEDWKVRTGRIPPKPAPQVQGLPEEGEDFSESFENGEPGGQTEEAVPDISGPVNAPNIAPDNQSGEWENPLPEEARPSSRPSISDEQRENAPRQASSQYISSLDLDPTEAYQDPFFESPGEGIGPSESSFRVRKVVPEGTRVAYTSPVVDSDIPEAREVIPEVDINDPLEVPNSDEQQDTRPRGH